jgi:hypothetical protein
MWTHYGRHLPKNPWAPGPTPALQNVIGVRRWAKKGRVEDCAALRCAMLCLGDARGADCEKRGEKRRGERSV